jgi:uncharacterized protein YacL
MFCASCGNTIADTSQFCPSCGASRNAPASMPTPKSAGSGFSVAGIICGAIAFLFFPIVLGPIGLILGAIGKSKGEEKAVVAMVVSALGLVIGLILGFLVFASL